MANTITKRVLHIPSVSTCQVQIQYSTNLGFVRHLHPPDHRTMVKLPRHHKEKTSNRDKRKDTETEKHRHRVALVCKDFLLDFIRLPSTPQTLLLLQNQNILEVLPMSLHCLFLHKYWAICKSSCFQQLHSWTEYFPQKSVHFLPSHNFLLL